MDVVIRKARPLTGDLTVPGDKSISHRALLYGALGAGDTVVKNVLDSRDLQSTVQCLKDLGINYELSGTSVTVKGKGLHGFQKPAGELNAGNSGTTLRLLAGILAGQPFSATLTGDDSLRRRPMHRIIEPLTQMGARIGSAHNGRAPLVIHGSPSLKPLSYTLPIPSAQVKSSILLAGLFAPGETTVIETFLSRDHTERMFGLRSTKVEGSFRASIAGGAPVQPAVIEVPGDISSAAFLIAAAATIKGSDLLLRNVGLNPTRAAALEIFRNIGATIEIEDMTELNGEPRGTLRIRNVDSECSISLNETSVPHLIDEIPILAVATALRRGFFEVRGAGELRHKESDRISALVANLRALHIEVEEHDDGFSFQSSGDLRGTTFQSYGDHRIAMAFGIAALMLPGESTILGSECVAVSFPDFWKVIGGFF